eukprot:scaffold2719_cov112-Skeletonema_marinoi.AAC.2
MGALSSSLRLPAIMFLTQCYIAYSLPERRDDVCFVGFVDPRIGLPQWAAPTLVSASSRPPPTKRKKSCTTPVIVNASPCQVQIITQPSWGATLAVFRDGLITIFVVQQ